MLYDRSILYHICVPSFFDGDADGIGDLKGITEKISYLHTLGVDAIVLSPIFETNQDSLRYAVTDYYRINPVYGTKEDFDRLLSTAHEKGLRVYLSIPITSTSSAHEWFERSENLTDNNPYSEYYCRSKGKNGKNHIPPDKDKGLDGDAVWVYSKKCEDWYKTVFGKDYPALNYDNPRVRKEMSEVFLFWKENGVDGFFIDDSLFIIKNITLSDGKPLYHVNDDLYTTGRKLYRFLKELREKIGASFPIVLTSEGMPQTTYPYLVSENRPIADSIVSECCYTANRFRAPRHFSKKKFISSYLQMQQSYCNNISVMFNDRMHRRLLSSYIKDSDSEILPCAKFLATILLSSIGTPNLYQGEEIGMQNFTGKSSTNTKKIEANQRDLLVLSDARSPFQWDNKVNAAFTSAAFPYLPVHDNYHKINAVAEANDQQSILNYYRTMIAFRKASSALTMGDFTDHTKGSVLCFVRASETERLLIIANSNNKHINFSVPSLLIENDAQCEICNYPLVSKPLHPSMGLRPYEVRIFRLTPPLKALN